MLTPRISADKICAVIQMAREWGGTVEPTLHPQAKDLGDDNWSSAMQDTNPEVVEQDLAVFIDRLAPDEQADLLALSLVGRGDYAPEEWQEAQSAAEDSLGDNIHELLRQPLLASHLSAAMDAFDMDCPTEIDRSG